MPDKRLTRAEKRAKIREDLLDAAEALFAESGYWGVSIDQIAERAGVTKGAVYSNFANKEALLLGVAWRQRIDISPTIFEDPSLSLEDLARKLGEEIARVATSEEQRRSAPRELEISTLALSNETIRTLLADMAKIQRATIAAILTERAESHGVELPLPADELAAIIGAMQRGLMQQRFIDPDAIPPHYFADALALPFLGQASTSSKPKRQPQKAPSARPKKRR